MEEVTKYSLLWGIESMGEKGKEKELMKSCILNKETSSWGLSPLRARETSRKENGGFVSKK